MPLTLEQYNALQPRVLEVQRLALYFAELGEQRVSRDLLAAATRASKIRPTKAAADQQADQQVTDAASKKGGKGA